MSCRVLILSKARSGRTAIAERAGRPKHWVSLLVLTVIAASILLLQGVSSASAAITITYLGKFSGSNIKPVEALSDNVCLVGGNWSSGGGAFPVGVSYRTANGATPFTGTKLATCLFLNDYSFTNSTNGWAIGMNMDPSAIYKTTDAGATWKQQPAVPYRQSMKVIAFPDSLHGWIAGQQGMVIATANGGVTWTQQTSPLTWDINDMVFKGAQNGWAVGDNGGIARTTNGGTTWTKIASPVIANLKAVDFLDSTRGVIVGQKGTVLTTTDGGAHWTKRLVPNIYSGGYIQIDFRDVDWIGSDVFAVGEVGTLVRSYNGGTTWVQEKTTVSGHFIDISFSSPGRAWISAEQGALYRLTRTFTPDTATTYTKRTSGVTNFLFAVDFADASYGWVAGNGGVVLKTTNGGTTWTRIARGVTDDMITGIDFVNRTTGYMAANHTDYATPDFHGYIYKTTDGGATWKKQTHPNDGTLVFRVRMQSATSGWISGDQYRINQVPSPPPPPYSSILRTTNGGTTWVRHKNSPKDMMRDFAFPSSLVGYACGYRGANYRTTNGGTDWIRMTSLTGIDRAMGTAFTSAYSGVIVGDVYATADSPGVIAQTTNGGRTWTKPSLPTLQQLRCASKAGSNVWAVGEGNTVLHSGNGGTSWGKQTTGTSGVAFWGVSSFSADKVVAVGSGGTILVGRRPSCTMYTPTVPTTIYHGRTFAISGTLKPLHTTGYTKLYVYRYVSGRYLTFKILSARNTKASSTTTRYAASMSTPYAGKYYVKAYFTDADHYPSWSAVRYFTIR